ARRCGGGGGHGRGVRDGDGGPAVRRRPTAPARRARAARVPRAPVLGCRHPQRRLRLGHRRRGRAALRSDPVSARTPSVLLVGEFGAGALALSYARAFQSLGWRTVRYDMTLGYTRGGALARRRVLRRALRPALWALMSRETVALAAR